MCLDNLISYPLQTIIIWFLPKPHITNVSLKLSFLWSTMTSKLPSSQMCLNPYFIWSHCELCYLWLLSPFPLWLWRLLFILLLVYLSDHILSVSCWFAFLWLCLEDDVLEDSIPGHLFTVNLFLQQSNKFLPFLVQFSRSVISDSLQPHKPQHAKPFCPSPTPRVHPNPCPSSWWCHPTICCPLFIRPPIPPSIRVFSNESALQIRWPKYWSFSLNISPSNEYPGLISFRMDWLDLFAVQGTLKSLLQHHSSKASILQCSLSL